MSLPRFVDHLNEWPRQHVLDAVSRAAETTALHAMAKAEAGHSLTEVELAALLSPAAVPHLERMAQAAYAVTSRMFGRTVHLFTPLYLSNYCTNRCVYCGFNTSNNIRRSMLSLDDIEAAGKAIAATGLRNILLLTGDAPKKTGPDYMTAAAKRLLPYFSSIGIEVYALTTEEYGQLADAGVDSMTLFQETYNEKLYPSLHPAGPKSDFFFRLEAPTRAAAAGMRSVNVGALLGLDLWQYDAFSAIRHVRWLEHTFPGVETALSVPRIRPHAGAAQNIEPVSDQDLTQIILAARLYLPMTGITLSSRESPRLRDAMIPLGVTRVSAGVSTAVGGHFHDDDDDNEPQFHISDDRNVDDMAAAIRSRGFQPVFTSWNGF